MLQEKQIYFNGHSPGLKSEASKIVVCDKQLNVVPFHLLYFYFIYPAFLVHTCLWYSLRRFPQFHQTKISAGHC